MPLGVLLSVTVISIRWELERRKVAVRSGSVNQARPRGCSADRRRFDRRKSPVP
jgi:hypothetical protein